MLFFLQNMAVGAMNGATAMLVNSLRLERRHYVLFGVLNNDAMLLHLELRPEASKKDHFIKYIRQHQS
jgi:hypothetical protein